ncbi:hypothetical protein D9M73_62150 [compost metagenome]
MLHQGSGFACFWLQCLPLCGLQQGPYFTPVIHAAQLLAQYVAEGDGAVDHAHPHIGQVTTRLRGLHRYGKVDQALALAREIAAAQEQLAPELACLPVAVIGGGVAKTEEDGQRQANQRERDSCQRDFLAEERPVRERDHSGQQDVDDQDCADLLKH